MIKRTTGFTFIATIVLLPLLNGSLFGQSVVTIDPYKSYVNNVHKGGEGSWNYTAGQPIKIDGSVRIENNSDDPITYKVECKLTDGVHTVIVLWEPTIEAGESDVSAFECIKTNPTGLWSGTVVVSHVVGTQPVILDSKSCGFSGPPPGP